MKVTADTITDEQINAIWNAVPPDERTHGHAILVMTARSKPAGPAYRKPTREEIDVARTRCAEIWNARHGGES